jgi:hypothetical protein
VSTKKQVARAIVSRWYEQWTGYPSAPNVREIRSAVEWIDRVGAERMIRVIPVVIDLMQTEWPEAKRWGAVPAYLPEALGVLAERDGIEAAKKRKAEAVAKGEPEQTPEETEKWQAAIKLMHDAWGSSRELYELFQPRRRVRRRGPVSGVPVPEASCPGPGTTRPRRGPTGRPGADGGDGPGRPRDPEVPRDQIVGH